MLSRRTLEDLQRNIELAKTPGGLLEAQASYARAIVNELLSLIADVRRGWEANHLAEELVSMVANGGTLAGSNMGAVQLVSFSTALAGFDAFMGMSMSNPAVAAIAEAAGLVFEVSPLMLVDGVAMTPREIIGKMNWPTSVPVVAPIEEPPVAA